MNRTKLKKYLILISLFFIIIFSIKMHGKTLRSKEDKILLVNKYGKKRTPNILLYNCHYGAGHEMATQSILESLPDCNIHVVDIYAEPLKPLDPMRELLPALSNEAIYNNMAKFEKNSLLNFLGIFGPKALLLQKTKIEKLLKESIALEKPDLIISCVPLVNTMLNNVAKELDIPFLIVTTDIDISAFCYGFEDKKSPVDRNKFRITVPFSKDTWDDKFKELIPNEVKNSLQYSFGYPTRKAFSENVEDSVLNQLRREYQIQDNENVILVMMGGNTAKAAKSYAKLLLNMTEEEITQIVGQDNKKDRIRLICLCGDVTQYENQKLMTYLNNLNQSKKSNDRVSIHACPGTPRIAEIVSLPELCTVISKPGGSTVNEMIKKKVPMIYHISKVPLDWERGNMEYGISHGLGKSLQISDKNPANSQKELIEALSSTIKLHDEILEGTKTIPESDFVFSDSLRSAVKEMLLIDENICKK